MGCSSSKGASQTRRHPDGQEALHKAAKSYNKDVIMQLSDAQLDEFRDAFKQFDKDGGGSIDAQELAQLMASVGQMPSEDEVNEMVRIADADGSGSIDFPEFVTLMAHKSEHLSPHVRHAFAPAARLCYVVTGIKLPVGVACLALSLTTAHLCRIGAALRAQWRSSSQWSSCGIRLPYSILMAAATSTPMSSSAS